MRANVVEFAPDQAPLDSGASSYLLNAVPRTVKSYGPIGSLNSFGSALNGRCRGASSWRGVEGTVVTIAGTSTKLSVWSGTDWVDATRTVGGDYAVADTDQWDATAFGGEMIAVNGTDTPQRYTIGTSSTFANLTGSPPIPRFVCNVGDFLMVARIAGADNRVQWPDIRSVTAWASGQADDRDLFEGGRIMGLCGGRTATVLSETAIHLFIYTGDSKVFESHPISLELGCAAEGSVAQKGDTIVFLSADGFYAITGGQMSPIGRQKIDGWFWERVDPTKLYNMSAAIDPITRYYWLAYTSLESVDGYPDEVLIFNPDVQRWGYAKTNLDILANMRTNVGLDLDSLDDVYGDLDSIPFSLDSPLLMGQPTPTFAAFGPDARLGFLNGPNLAAKFQVEETNLSGRNRTFLYPTWPLVDGGNPKVRIGSRNRLNDPIVWGDAVAQNAAGRCPAKSKARYQTARIEMDAGDVWDHMQGVEFEGKPCGGR